MPKTLERAEDFEPVNSEPKMSAVVKNSSTLSQKMSAVETNSIHAEPEVLVVGTDSSTKSRKISAVGTGSSTKSRKCRRWEPTHPRRAENTGGGNRFFLASYEQ